MSIWQRQDGRYGAKMLVVLPDGSRRSIQATASTRKEALRRLDQRRKRLEAGKPARDSSATVADVAQRWLTVSLPASARAQTTKDLYAGEVRRHLLGETSEGARSEAARRRFARRPALLKIGATPLKALSASDVEEFLLDVEQRGFSVTSRRRLLQILRAILDTAVRDGKVRAQRRPRRPKARGCDGRGRGVLRGRRPHPGHTGPQGASQPAGAAARPYGPEDRGGVGPPLAGPRSRHDSSASGSGQPRTDNGFRAHGVPRQDRACPTYGPTRCRRRQTPSAGGRRHRAGSGSEQAASGRTRSTGCSRRRPALRWTPGTWGGGTRLRPRPQESGVLPTDCVTHSRACSSQTARASATSRSSSAIPRPARRGTPTGTWRSRPNAPLYNDSRAFSAAEARL